MVIINKNILKKYFSHFILIAYALSITGCAAVGNSFARLNIYSTEEEIKTGSDWVRQNEPRMRINDDRILNAYIAELGQRLVKNSKRKDIKYAFKVVNDESINAFALPGGYCYINTGLINFTDNEPELASVIGHEIGHVVGRHSAKQLSKQRTFGFLYYAGYFITYFITGAAPPRLAKKTVGLLNTSILLNYGRGAELEADRLGIQEMHDSGIDPYGAQLFFEKLAEREKGGERSNLEKMLSSHPPTADRIKQAKKEIRKLAMKKYDPEISVGFSKAKERLKQLKIGGKK